MGDHLILSSLHENLVRPAEGRIPGRPLSLPPSQYLTPLGVGVGGGVRVAPGLYFVVGVGVGGGWPGRQPKTAPTALAPPPSSSLSPPPPSPPRAAAGARGRNFLALGLEFWRWPGATRTPVVSRWRWRWRWRARARVPSRWRWRWPGWWARDGPRRLSEMLQASGRGVERAPLGFGGGEGRCHRRHGREEGHRRRPCRRRGVDDSSGESELAGGVCWMPRTNIVISGVSRLAAAAGSAAGSRRRRR